jgi:hypothetical protein
MAQHIHKVFATTAAPTSDNPTPPTHPSHIDNPSLPVEYPNGTAWILALCANPTKGFSPCSLLLAHPTSVKSCPNLLATLKEHCYALKTSPALVEILNAGLIAWFQDQPLCTDDFDSEYQPLLQEQACTGWSHFFNCRITKQ